MASSLASLHVAQRVAPVKWSDESDDESTSGGGVTDCSEEAAPLTPPGTFAEPWAQPQQVFLMPVVVNGMQVLMPMVAVDGGMMPATAEQMQGMAMVPSAQMPGAATMPMDPRGPRETEGMGPTHFGGYVAELEVHAETLACEATELTRATRCRKALSASAPRRGIMADEADTVARLECEGGDGDGRATLMFRNLPKCCSRSILLRLLDEHGFKLDYCFAYVPVDFKRLSSLGYGFVGFHSHEDAARAQAHFQGFDWDVPDAQPCDVVWSGVQGQEQHVERYRNSPVMHHSVPDEYKPAVYLRGQRLAFPAPTKRIQPPRLRQSAAGFQ